MKRKDLLQKNVSTIVDVECPHCLHSLLDEDKKILLLSYYQDTVGVIALSSEYRNYELSIFGIENLPFDALVRFVCPSCKKDLMIQSDYFHFLVRFPDQYREWAFMSARFGHHFTLVAPPTIADKIRRNKMSLSVYERMSESMQSAFKDYEPNIRYYSSGKTFIP